MQDSLRMGKRALTIAVAAATILWSIGFSAFVAPLTARAASAGDLVKGTTLSTLYYYASDGKRYAFPNEKTYLTWYSDFSGVQTLSDSALAALPLGGNVLYRPGSHWVKIQSDPKTYAVTPSGQLRWIETEAAASGLAGSDWNQFIDDVPDVFFVDYTVGASLTSAANAYNGALVKASDGTNYLIWNAQKRLVSSAGFSANRYQTRNLLDGTGVNLAGIAAGSDLTAQEATLVNTAQTAEVATTGGLTVSLASDSPVAMTVPSQATSITFLKFNLAASSGTATVNQVTLKQGGVGATSTVSNVYLYEGAKRLTNGRSVNSSSREATFSGLNLSLAAGQTKTLSVVVDMANNPTGGDTVQFELASASAVVGSATVGGAFPVRGATMTTSATDVGTATIAKNGSIVDPILGKKGAEVAQFKITASSTEGLKLNSLRLDVRDATDHANYQLKQNDVLQATGVAESSDKVMFVFSKPFEIAQGADKIFIMYADVGGQDNDTIKVALEENSDLNATGDKYSFGVAVTKTDYDETGGTCVASTDDCSFSTIQGGKLTIAFNGPSKTKVRPDQTGVVLMNLTITSQNAVQIREMGFDVICDDCDGTATTDANFQSFRLVNKATGGTVAGPEEFDATFSDEADDVTFPDDWNMAAGQSLDLQLLVDFKGSTSPYDVGDAEGVTATLDVSTISARDANNDDLTVGTDVIPGTDLVGNEMEADTSSLTVAVSQPPTRATFVKGAQGVDMLGLSWAAGTSSSAKLSALTLSGSGDDATVTTWSRDVDPRTYITSCSLYDGTTGGLIDGPESFGADAAEIATGTDHNIVFSGFSWTIPAGQTYKMIVDCNLANVAPTSSNSDAFMVELNHTNDVTAVDSDGDSIVANGTAGAIDINGIASAGDASSDIYQTLASAGTLTAAVDGDTPKATLVLGQSTSVEVSRFKITAATESFLVRKLTVQNASAVLVPGVTSVALEYKDQAGATRTKSGILDSSAKITYELGTGEELYVAKDESPKFSVKVNTGDVTTDNTASGDVINLDWVVDTTNDDEFEAVGVSSGTTLDDDDVAGSTGSNAHEQRKTKPTISLASGSPSGAGVPGLAEVFRFSISADSRGYVTWSEMMFAFNTTDNNGAGTTNGDWNECDGADGVGGGAQTLSFEDDDFDLFDASDLSTNLINNAAKIKLLESDGTTCEDTEKITHVLIDLEGGTTTVQEVGAGATKTYILKIDTTNASASSDDSLRVDITDESITSGADPNDLSFEWDDSNVTNTDALDIDGDNVKNLPVNGGTIVY